VIDHPLCHVTMYHEPFARRGINLPNVIIHTIDPVDSDVTLDSVIGD
jgi:hypothetical protein